MSTGILGKIHYKCFNDCKETGCPGHELQLEDFFTADILNVKIDKIIEYHFDINFLSALLEIYKEFVRQNRYSGEHNSIDINEHQL